MNISKFLSIELSTIRCVVVALIFFQLLAHAKCVNILCKQKNDGGTCKEFTFELDEIRDANNGEQKIMSRAKRSYVSKFKIEELLKLEVKKSVSNDLDMYPEKSGWLKTLSKNKFIVDF